MANAWCINAIWFDWSLIRTLENLDSSNIWVWVQFTAPNPLDDKRFDYIKYTDKCWNTCCLTWENEILIYATQWTLKNLTLTNDDANEVVNVKRSDVFWSNRKKTVVRYKTWSYPTSITDWTLAVEELVQNQYASTWYNVSWLSDWTTYYFSAFAVAQDDTIIVVQSSSITTDFWRKPWVNTMWYRTLVWNANDSSWNNRNWTATWVSFWTYDWVDCAYFSWSYSSQIRIPWMWSFSALTMVIWAKTTYSLPAVSVLFMLSPSSNNKNFAIQWNSSKFILSRRNWSSAYDINDWTANDGVRHCIIATYDSSWADLYVDWVHIWHDSRSSQVQSDTNYSSIWWHASNSSSQFTYRWYLSTAIVENKKRTEAEWLAYYNKVKTQFWK